MTGAIQAVVFDLDDTLWPVGPAIAGAEQALRAWLLQHAPRAGQLAATGMQRQLREQVLRDHPQRAYDLVFVRRQVIEALLRQAGEDPGLADQAFAVFYRARSQVTLFADVLPAITALRGRYRMAALSNGFADLSGSPLGELFEFQLAAHQIGAAKPDARTYQAACDRLGLEPAKVLHVGDDPTNDIDGPRAVAMPVVWVNRYARAWPEGTPAPPAVTHLGELRDWLLQGQ